LPRANMYYLLNMTDSIKREKKRKGETIYNIFIFTICSFTLYARP